MRNYNYMIDLARLTEQEAQEILILLAFKFKLIARDARSRKMFLVSYIKIFGTYTDRINSL